MTNDNYLDDLGITSDSDDNRNSDPNLIQGKEFMKYERNYNHIIEPRLQLLEATSSPNLTSITEGMTTQKTDQDGDNIEGDSPIVVDNDDPVIDNLLTKFNTKLKSVNEYEEKFKQTTSDYIEYLQNTKDIKSSLTNSIAYNSDTVDSITVYNQYDKNIIDNENNNNNGCLNIANIYRIKQGDWGDAKDIIPVKEWYSGNCLSGEKAFSGLPLPNSSVSTVKQKVEPKMKQWRGWAISSLVFGVNTSIGGKFDIKIVSDNTNPLKNSPLLSRPNYYLIGNNDNTQNTVPLKEAVLNTSGKAGYGSVSYGGSLPVVQIYYISDTDKQNLTQEIEIYLSRIISDNFRLSLQKNNYSIEYFTDNKVNMKENIKNSWYNPADANNKSRLAQNGICLHQIGQYFLSPTTATLDSPNSNVDWTLPTSNIPGITDGLSDAKSADEVVVALAQAAAAAAANKAEKAEQANVSEDKPNSIQNRLKNGHICGWSCIEGCPGWSNYDVKTATGEAIPGKQSKTCSINQCNIDNFDDPVDFTYNLVYSILLLRSQLYPPGDLSDESMNALSTQGSGVTTCQELANAYGIYANESGIIAQCDNDPNIKQAISSQWNNSKCSETVTSPDFGAEDISNIYSKCPGRINSQWKTKVLKYYPERYFINKYGYRQRFTEADNIKQYLVDIKNHCEPQTLSSDSKSGTSSSNTTSVSHETTCNAWNDEIIPWLDELDRLGTGCLGTNDPSTQNILSINGVSTSVLSKLEEGADIQNLSPGGDDDVTGKTNTTVCNNISGSIIQNKDKPEQYAWVDVIGYKIPMDNNDDCKNYLGDITPIPVSSDVYNKIPTQTENVGSILKCRYYDARKYSAVENAYQLLLNSINELSSIKHQLDAMDTTLGEQLNSTQKKVDDTIVSVNKKMDIIDRIRLDKTTAEGREESTTLIANSNKLQFIAWLIVALLLFIYGMYSISNGVSGGALHIVALIACVVILFIILRRFYLSGIA